MSISASMSVPSDCIRRLALGLNAGVAPCGEYVRSVGLYPTFLLFRWDFSKKSLF